MLQVSEIKENKELIVQGLLKKRFLNAEEVINKVLHADQERRNTQSVLDAQLAEANAIAKQVGALMKTGKREEAEAIKARTAELK